MQNANHSRRALEDSQELCAVVDILVLDVTVEVALQVASLISRRWYAVGVMAAVDKGDARLSVPFPIRQVGLYNGGVLSVRHLVRDLGGN